MSMSPALREKAKALYLRMAEVGVLTAKPKRVRRPLLLPSGERLSFMGPVVSMGQIAIRLGVTIMTVRAWRDGSSYRRRLPHTHKRIGKRNQILIKERDLIQFLREYRPDLARKWQGE